MDSTTRSKMQMRTWRLIDTRHSFDKPSDLDSHNNLYPALCPLKDILKGNGTRIVSNRNSTVHQPITRRQRQNPACSGEPFRTFTVSFTTMIPAKSNGSFANSCHSTVIRILGFIAPSQCHWFPILSCLRGRSSEIWSW